MVDGLEQAPDALNRLFDGTNTGKLIVRVSDEPAGPGMPGPYGSSVEGPGGGTT